jgi:hypothetical protein
MYQVQYKENNVLETWTTMGTYGTEQQAIANAVKKRLSGAIITRVIDRNRSVIFTH